MKFTPQQQHAINLFESGNRLCAIAFAGAGKTSTLVGMAKVAQSSSRKQYGLYVAFNKAIQLEARAKFPGNVTAQTAHSIAYRHVAQMGFSDQKLNNKAWSRDFHFRDPVNKEAFNDVLQKSAFLGFVAQIINRFCQSDADEIDMIHVPNIPEVQPGKRPNRIIEENRYPAMLCAREIWAQMSDPMEDLPLGHDGYVKVWALTRPQFRVDFVFADEAQDLNPVLIRVLKEQNAPVISVGDSHQQIYEWRGARDALPQFGGEKCHLTQSFRFGPAIAEAADGLLWAMGEDRTLYGIDCVDRICHGEPEYDFLDAILCRTNAGVIGEAVTALNSGRSVYITGGAKALVTLVEDVQRLKVGKEARTPELSPFVDWQAVCDFSETEEGGGLRTLVSLVKSYDIIQLLSILERIGDDPREPGVLTVSTAHKAKGLEWELVRVSNDFEPREDGKIPLPQRRLFYVAATRAKRFLNVSERLLHAYSQPNKET